VYPQKGPPFPPRTGVRDRQPGLNWNQAFGHLIGTVPVFAGEWGVEEANEDNDNDRLWAEHLGQYLSSLAMGWAAWSWHDRPRLIRGNPPRPYDPTRYGRVVLRSLALP